MALSPRYLYCAFSKTCNAKRKTKSVANPVANCGTQVNLNKLLPVVEYTPTTIHVYYCSLSNVDLRVKVLACIVLNLHSQSYRVMRFFSQNTGARALLGQHPVHFLSANSETSSGL